MYELSGKKNLLSLDRSWKILLFWCVHKVFYAAFVTISSFSPLLKSSCSNTGNRDFELVFPFIFQQFILWKIFVLTKSLFYLLYRNDSKLWFYVLEKSSWQMKRNWQVNLSWLEVFGVIVTLFSHRESFFGHLESLVGMQDVHKSRSLDQLLS